MWKYKTNAKGLPTTAVTRRLNSFSNPDFTLRKDRLKFGYCYLEFVKMEEK